MGWMRSGLLDRRSPRSVVYAYSRFFTSTSMHATNVRNLKKNPSAALRHAEKEPVLVLKGDEPNALIVHLDASITEGEASVRPALAVALFREGVLSLGAACRLSRMELPDFIRYLAELGIDVVRPDETTDREPSHLDPWLAR
ncbi:MAG: prevent-host-death protein [Gammaproteobacteria bacterium]|nr:MAG: prevent-host-death protein [Gammaproteobacteria bacterium]